MIGSELYFSLFVGIVLSLIFAEKFGINPGTRCTGLFSTYIRSTHHVVICVSH